MSSVDERIVKMTFDNHLFEKNAGTTINTLEKLKSALTFGGSAHNMQELEKTASRMDFSRLVNSVDTLNGRFSSMGVAGMTVISNLTTAAMNLGNTLAHKVLDPIKTGGWNRATNIDQAKFKMEGLHVAWDDIQADINHGVHDTAYGLDAAASAAAQLVASGVEYGETFGETGNSPMAKALRGISGVAAMTSESYEVIADIFTDAAGMGKVTSDTMNRIAARGLNAKQVLADFYKTNQAGIDEMLRKGKIGFKDFAEAMDNAFGVQATKSNETFEGSLANMKAALGRIGAEFATPIRKNMTDVFNAIRPIINTLNTEKLQQVYKDFADFASKASGFIVNVLGKIDLSFVDGLVSKLHEAYVEFDRIMTAINPLWKAAVETTEETEKATEAVVKSAEDIEEKAREVIAGKYGYGDARRKALEKEGYIYEEVQNKVNELCGSTYRYEIAEKKAGEATDKTANLMDKKKSILEKINDSNEKYRQQVRKMFGLQTKEEKRTEKLNKIMGNIAPTVGGLTSAFNILTGVTGAIARGGFDPMIDILLNIGEIITNITAYIGEWITAIDKVMTETGAYDAIASGINTTLTFISDTLGGISGFIDTLTSDRGIIGAFTDLFAGDDKTVSNNDFAASVDNVTGKISTFLGIIGSYILNDAGSAFEAMVTKLSELFPTLSKLWPIVDEILFAILKLNGFKALNSVFKTIETVPKLLKSYANERNSRAVRNMAISIGILAASLFALSQLSWSQLAVGATAIVVLAAALGGLYLIVNKLNGGDKGSFFGETISSIGKAFAADKNATSILKIAAAFGVLAASLFALSQLSWNQLAVGAVAIGVLTAAVVIMAKALGFGANTNGGGLELKPLKMLNDFLNGISGAVQSFLKKVGTGALIAAFALAVLAITVAITQLTSVSWKDGLKAITFMGAIFLMLAAEMEILKKVSGGKGYVSMSVLMVALGVVVKSLSKTIASLSEIPWKQGLKSIGFLGLLFVELSLALKAITTVASSNGKVSIRVIALLGAIALVVKSLSSTLVKLSEIKFSSGIKALGLLGALFIELGLAIKGMQTAASSGGKISIKMMVLMGVMALVVKSLGGTLSDLTKIPLKSGIKALGFLASIFGIMLIVLGIGSKITKMKGVFGMALFLGTFTLAIQSMSTAIKTLANIDAAGIKQAIKAIGEISLILSGVMVASRFMNKSMADSLKSIMPIVLTLAAFTASLYVLSNIDPSRLDASAKAITKIMNSLSLFTFASKGFGKGNIGSIISNYVGLGAIIGEIAFIFDKLKKLDPDQMLSISDSMSKVITALSALSAAAGLLGSGSQVEEGKGGFLANFSSTLGTGLANDINIAALLGIVTGIEALAGLINKNFPSFKDLLNDGIPLLEKIAEGIGKFIGKIIEYGLFKPLADSGLGTSLSSFMDSLQPFLDGTNNLSEDNVDAIDRLYDFFDKIAGMGWSAVSASISGIFFSEDGLDSLVTDLGEFIDKFNGTDGLATKLDAIGDDSSGYVSKIQVIKDVFAALGDSAWEGFITNIKSAFFENGSTAESGISKLMTDLATFVGEFAGDQGFAKKLEAVGDDSKTYTGKIQVIKDVFAALGDTAWEGWIANIKGSFFNGGDSAEELKTLMTNLGTFIDAYAGETGFIKKLDALGEDSSGYISKITAVREILTELGDTAWSGWVSAFKSGFFNDTEVSSLQALMTDAGTVMGSFKTFIDSIEVLGEDNGDSAVKKIEAVDTIIDKLGTLGWGGYWASIKANLFGSEGDSWGVNQITGLIDNMGIVVDKFGEFVPKLDPLTGENIEKVDNVSAMIKKLGDSALSAFITNMDTYYSNDSSLIAYAENLITFARYMRRYANIAKGIDTNAIDATDNAIEMLMAYGEAVPNEGGLLGIFVGNNNIADYGENLITFAKKIKTYTTEIQGVDMTNAIAVSEGIIQMSEAFNKITAEGFLDPTIMGDKLNQVYQAISGTFNTIAGAVDNPDNITTFKESGKRILGYIISGLKEAGEDTQNGDFMQSIKDQFSEEKVESLKENGKSIADTVLNSIKEVFVTDTSLNTGLLAFTETNITAVTDYIVAQVGRFVHSVDLIKGNILLTVEMTKYLLETKVGIVSQTALDKVDSYYDKFTGSVKSITNACVNAVGAYEDDFRNAGRNLIAGFEDGIASMARRAADAAANVAISAYNAMTRVLEIHSPSKKGKYVGEMLDDGVSMGISDSENLVSKSAASVGATAVKSVRDQIKDARKSIAKTAKKTGHSIGTVVSDNLWIDDASIKKTADKVNKVISSVDTKSSNSKPVITPVLDVTKLQNGSKYVDDILSDGTDSTYSANFTGSIDLTAITSSINQSSNTLGAKIDLTNQKIANLNNTLDSFNGPQNAVFLSLMYEMMGIYFPQFATLPEEDQEAILSSQQMSARMAMLAKRAR